MAAATVVPLSKESQSKLIAYYNSVQDNLNTRRGEQRARFLGIDKQYQREMDLSEEQARAKAANNAGDPNRFQNMTVPVVMPQVEAAVVHQTSVFLTGEPLFGVVAAPTYMDEALQLESILEENSIKGGWVRQLLLFFRDGFKYNFAPLEVTWQNEVTWNVETDLEVSLKEGVPKEVTWSGNSIRRLDPYNTFVDPRVSPTEVYKDGEFVGYTEYMSRIKLKSYIAALPDKIIANIRPAFESSMGALAGATSGEAKEFYIADVNPEVTNQDVSGDVDWFAWAELDTKEERKIDYKGAYDVTTFYAKILPAEFGIRATKSKTPQIYKLVIVNHSVIIYAELQTNAHNYLPVVIGSPLEDGLRKQTKSLAENGVPFQQLASALMNSVIASRRRAISDRVLYDPSRITSAQINSANPSAKIPVRPSAYGKDIKQSVYQFPYRDDQSAAAMQQVQGVLGLANTLNGQNQAQQGQFVKGNKTLHEYESVMQNANGRDQLASILLEHQCFSPIKRILKFNTLQYQGGESIYNRDKDVVVEVDPVKLRQAVLDFRISDGLTPASKILNSETFSVALQVIGSNPQLAAEYNMGPMFSYMMKTQGANLTEFEKSQEQVAYEQAMQQWQQLAMEAIHKGADISKLPAQPIPENYGYKPNKNKPQPEEVNTNETPSNAEGL